MNRFCLRACMCINTVDITRRERDKGTSTHTYKASVIHTNRGFAKQWLFRGRHNPGSGSLSLSLSPSLSLSACLIPPLLAFSLWHAHAGALFLPPPILAHPQFLAFSRFLSHVHVCSRCLSLSLVGLFCNSSRSLLVSFTTVSFSVSLRLALPLVAVFFSFSFSVCLFQGVSVPG